MSTSATSQLVGGAMTLNPSLIVGGISSIDSGVANMIGTIDKASALPNAAQGNVNSGDVSFGFNLNRFKYLYMRPKKKNIYKLLTIISLDLVIKYVNYKIRIFPVEDIGII